ncbi:hypothetical protein NC796_07610 [Aliifodinibius sp. S!AR15-10]|uniref:hypothetical protein n=1 Tax=Aliifodinibius sp. S!AR15-10 TaxID=2950437 RepID=UPI0028584AB5|nr:hypothetical protein [Aliifodinibius sp. S!AR15-10]MDR8390998.1 hypothetical protein [Aliifodinibius sp. S!AR15-10]
MPTITDKEEIRKGRELEFKYNGTKVGRVLSFSITVDGETINVSDIDSGEWNDKIRGRKDWNASLTAHRIEDVSGSSQQGNITSDFIDTTNSGSIELGPSSPTTGDVIYSGDAFVNSFTFDVAGSDEAVESSWEFEGDGALTRSVTA